MTKINLIDHYSATSTDIAEQLERLDIFLSENEEKIFACTCEDYDPPRGSYSYSDNSYSHHRDCPNGDYYHFHVYLAGLAMYFKSKVHTPIDFTNAIQKDQQ